MRRILVHSVAFYLALSLAHFLSSAPVSAAQNGRSNQPPGSGSGAAGQQMPPGNSPPSQPGPPTSKVKTLTFPRQLPRLLANLRDHPRQTQSALHSLITRTQPLPHLQNPPLPVPSVRIWIHGTNWPR